MPETPPEQPVTLETINNKYFPLFIDGMPKVLWFSGKPGVVTINVANFNDIIGLNSSQIQSQVITLFHETSIPQVVQFSLQTMFPNANIDMPDLQQGMTMEQYMDAVMENLP